MNLSDVHFAIPYLSLLVRFVEKVIQSSQDWSCPTKSKPPLPLSRFFLCRILLILDRYQVLYASRHISDTYNNEKIVKKKGKKLLPNWLMVHTRKPMKVVPVKSFFITVSLFSRRNENVDRCHKHMRFYLVHGRSVFFDYSDLLNNLQGHFYSFVNRVFDT